MANTPLLPSEMKTSASGRNPTSYRLSLEKREYLICVIITSICVLGWCWVAYDFSQESNPNYPLYANRLSPGWFNRPIDNSDQQYAQFRNNIPKLCLVLIAHSLISKLSNYNFEYRIWASLSFSLVFIFVLFGLDALKVLALLSLNYFITKALGNHKSMALIAWVYGIGILFANDRWNGYRFGSISQYLEWMDNIKGLGLRWYITFNFSMLRMISFAMDYHWMLTGKSKTGIANTERERIETCLPLHDYNFRNYLTYSLYSPLFMAGPIITFNNFLHQLKKPPEVITMKSTLKYMFRWIICVLTMETMIQLFWVVAIKDTKAWKGFSPVQIYSVGYINLKLIWLKLMIIWRFFRLWAMFDNIETVENMNRCMSNNYSGMEFWRDWHRSYNRWLIRYVYVPMGGNKYYAFNIFPVFTFVAIWHDIGLRLLAWGWLVPLFILPELLVTRIFCSLSMRQYFGKWHLHLCAAGAVVNILMMMTANLVGFAVGIEGIKEMIEKILDPQGLVLIASTLIGLFTGAHCMFWERAKEKQVKAKEH